MTGKRTPSDPRLEAIRDVLRGRLGQLGELIRQLDDEDQLRQLDEELRWVVRQWSREVWN